MANALLELEQAGKVIAKKTILEPVQIRMYPGDVLAICGGNAAGKSTLLRMIVGITRPSTGHVRINGKLWRKNRKACARQIGYMPDEFSFQPTLTAGETLRFYAVLRGADSAAADKLLRKVGLEEHRNQKISTFSLGMRKRLLFAQALLGDPPVLVLDEPTNGLDPYWVGFVESVIIDAKSRGKAVIFTTHQLDVAERTADRVMLLHQGRVIRHYIPGKSSPEEHENDNLRAAFWDVISEDPEPETV